MKFEKRRMSEKRTSVRRKSEHYRTALSRDPGFEKQKGPLSSSAWKANARPNRIPRGERGSEKTLIAEERLGGAFVACNSRRSHCGATGERRPQKKGQPRKKKKLSNSSEFPRRWAPNHRAPFFFRRGHALVYGYRIECAIVYRRLRNLFGMAFFLGSVLASSRRNHGKFPEERQSKEKNDALPNSAP